MTKPIEDRIAEWLMAPIGTMPTAEAVEFLIEAEAELRRLRGALEGVAAANISLKAHIAALEEEVTRLKRWLQDSAEHADICDKWVELVGEVVPFQYDDSKPCTCGLDALLKGGE